MAAEQAKAEGIQIVPMPTHPQELDFLSKCSNKVLDNVFKYAQNLRCQTILIEDTYICQDYRDEYSFLYSRAFHDYGSMTKRIHFFNCKVETLEEMYQLPNAAYLGFTVIRPLAIQMVGKTMLRPNTDAGVTFPLCAGEFKVHIGSKKFTVTAMPFTQQDGMVQVCAHASIWSALRLITTNRGGVPVLPSEISKLISEYTGSDVVARDFPSEGVILSQMVHVFKSLGYSPFPINLGLRPHENNPHELSHSPEITPEELFSFVYCYLESQFPVILTLPGHAVTACGHTLDIDRGRIKKKIDARIAKNQQKGDLYAIVFSDEWVNGLLIQNDADGPYRILPRTPEDRTVLEQDARVCNEVLCDEKDTFLTPEHFLTDEETAPMAADEKPRTVTAAIVPLFTSIFLTDKHVRERVRGLIIAAHEKDLWGFPAELKSAITSGNQNPIVLRMFLTRSTDFKKVLRDRLDKGDTALSPQLVKLYEKHPMPRHIWVCEISTYHEFFNEQAEDRKIFGEILIDAKAHRFDIANMYLAVHWGDSVMLFDRMGTNVVNTRQTLTQSKPYRCHMRKDAPLTEVAPLPEPAEETNQTPETFESTPKDKARAHLESLLAVYFESDAAKVLAENLAVYFESDAAKVLAENLVEEFPVNPPLAGATNPGLLWGYNEVARYVIPTDELKEIPGNTAKKCSFLAILLTAAATLPFPLKITTLAAASPILVAVVALAEFCRTIYKKGAHLSEEQNDMLIAIKLYHSRIESSVLAKRLGLSVEETESQLTALTKVPLNDGTLISVVSQDGEGLWGLCGI